MTAARRKKREEQRSIVDELVRKMLDVYKEVASPTPERLLGFIEGIMATAKLLDQKLGEDIDSALHKEAGKIKGNLRHAEDE